MITISIVALILAAASADSTVMVALVVVGLLFLTALSGVGAGPRKKKYCPFCGRQMEYFKMPKEVKLLCPHCKEPVESSS